SKLWQNDKGTEQSVERFSVGIDQAMDLYLASFDVLGSLADTGMLDSAVLLSRGDLEKVQDELKAIEQEILSGDVEIREGRADVHSKVEYLLTSRIGDAGKKIHSGRSRNDQVLVDLKLFFRSEIQKLAVNCEELFGQLLALSTEHKHKLMPGYTHLQIAMPS